MVKELVYFGHPVNSYDTVMESFLEDVIKEELGNVNNSDLFAGILFNPNNDFSKQMYQRYKMKEDSTGLDYYFSQVLPFCKAGVFLPFPEGVFGSGVMSEMKWFDDRGLPTYTIDDNGFLTKNDDILFCSYYNIQETLERVYDMDYFGNLVDKKS